MCLITLKLGRKKQLYILALTLVSPKLKTSQLCWLTMKNSSKPTDRADRALSNYSVLSTVEFENKALYFHQIDSCLFSNSLLALNVATRRPYSACCKLRHSMINKGLLLFLTQQEHINMPEMHWFLFILFLWIGFFLSNMLLCVLCSTC